MWFLLVLVIVLLLVVFLFAPAPPPGMQPSNLEDFAVPDNTSSKVVPKVYGTVYLKGNCIYYGNLTNKPLVMCS